MFAWGTQVVNLALVSFVDTLLWTDGARLPTAPASEQI